MKHVDEIKWQLRDLDDEVNVYFIDDNGSLFQIKGEAKNVKDINLPQKKKEYSIFFELKKVL